MGVKFFRCQNIIFFSKISTTLLLKLIEMKSLFL